MVVKMINGFFNSTMSAAWKPVRSFYDGASGSTHLNGAGKAWKDKNGENVILNPYAKLARRLKADAKQVVTGKKYNPATGEALDSEHGWFGRQIRGGGVGGILHGVGDLTLGTAATTLGWGARGTVGVGAVAGKHALVGAGHLAYQGARDTAAIVGGGASILHNMSKTGVGSNVLFAGGLAGTAGAAAIGMTMQETTKDRVAFYMNNQVDSLPGTLAAQGAAPGSDAMVSTGADGDLVLALHNMR